MTHAEFLRLCQGMPVRSFETKEALMTEGDKTGVLYILIEGSVDVTKNDLRVAQVRESGSIFGEISAMLGVPHMATVKALEHSTFYVVENAREFIRSRPEVSFHIAEVLAQRLSSVTLYLADLKKSLGNLMKLHTDGKEAKIAIEEKMRKEEKVGVLRIGEGYFQGRKN